MNLVPVPLCLMMWYFCDEARFLLYPYRESFLQTSASRRTDRGVVKLDSLWLA